MKKYSIIFLVLLMTFTSCEDFLTVVPETQLSSATFFKTEKDFVQAVNATYAPLRAYYNGPAWLLGELHSDNTFYMRNVLFGAVENAENLADFSVPVSNGTTPNTNVLGAWRGLYLIISRANQVLALIDGVQFNQDSKNNLKGQALFLRAFSYFHLVRYFGKVPLHLTPVSGRDGAALPLSEEAAVFDQIIKDLTEAVPLLPQKSQQEAGRVTQGAARTLLGDVFIYRKRWSDAEQVLAPVISSGQYALMPSYAMAFPKNSTNKNNIESVFEIQFREGADGLQGTFLYQHLPYPLTVPEVRALFNTTNPQPLDGQGNNIPTPDIIAAYEPGDLRKDASIMYITVSGRPGTNKITPIIKKFQDNHAQHNNHGVNWPVYRYAEVLLLMAEAQNEQGKTSEALGFLNQVRSRAGLPASTAAGQANVREAIFKERRVELAFENKRWFDIIRTDRIQEIIVPYGQRIVANPLDYYFPPIPGAVPRPNVFTNLDKFYAYPAVESDLSPHF
ncbi:RagB/SusD family nutrient uptake outer membrane protein [Algoriphagus sp. AK58]|uniref:RagB/SusD family nutrient uptake outer membrane protein n=1 Tax=Algoriphagus sp. AK58 TaxID=1406877 RepID=UPI0016501371|nr:RagB/SusD family nutrient uptake outer membrane protein [Algoriphagus sp. AK58]MBC6368310.1 RagB/SusD family nutrient uptake outer membrane protein [Algoriphagus sp. AK58]